MKVKELIVLLQACNPEDSVLHSSDEELNNLRSEIQIAKLTDMSSPTIVIYGLDGSEIYT